MREAAVAGVVIMGAIITASTAALTTAIVLIAAAALVAGLRQWHRTAVNTITTLSRGRALGECQWDSRSFVAEKRLQELEYI